MIVRVFRAQVRPGKQAEFEAKVRELSIPLVKSQPGLVAFCSGRPMESSPEEFVMVTIWESLAHLEAFAGEDWNHAVIPEPERPLLVETFVHHYQVIDRSQT
jgi:heme oxygenase (mycobilin-producing)